MSFLKVCSHSGSCIVIEVYDWNGEKKEHVCVGKFEVCAVEDCLNISALQDWRTHHRNNVELSYYSNHPRFHLDKLGVFGSFKVREVKEKVEVSC